MFTGSDIVFKASPIVVQPPITQYMWMKCSLTDKPMATVHPTSSGGLVGRSVPMRRTPHERVTHVTGITLYKDDVIIATVNQYFPAAMEAGVDLGHVNVTGDVSGTSDELG